MTNRPFYEMPGVQCPVCGQAARVLVCEEARPPVLADVVFCYHCASVLVLQADLAPRLLTPIGDRAGAAGVSGVAGADRGSGKNAKYHGKRPASGEIITIETLSGLQPQQATKRTGVVHAPTRESSTTVCGTQFPNPRAATVAGPWANRPRP